jgi:ABC-2 type transport system permease protein
MRKEFIQLRRDRVTLGMVICCPRPTVAVRLCIQTEVKHIPTVVFDQSVSAESRDS